MAKDKKSVLLYCDLIHTVEKLTNTQAGKLFKHYLRYVNDLEPKCEDVLIDLVFEPIKQDLKRDLKKWESIKVKRSEAGKASAEKRQQKQQVLTSVDCVETNSTNPTVTVTVNDTVTVKDIYYIEEIQFLSDWAKVRLHFDGKPTNIKKLTTFESVNFNKLKHLFTRDEFRAAIQGMFEQKNMYASTRLRPTHFLDDGNLEKYLDCKINKIKLFKDD